MQEMNGQIALVTGAGRGIGSAIAKSLAKEGATVIVNYAGNAQAAQDTVDSILKDGGSAEKYQCDVSDFAAVEEMIKYIVQKYEKIDILVNNAGFGLFGNFTETDLSKELNMIDINIKAVHILTKLFLKDMKRKNKGYILNVASSAAFQSGPLMATYYSTKSYVYRLTEAINYENKKDKVNVQVSCLCPGPVDTNFNKVAGVRFSVKPLKADYVAKYAIDQMLKGKMLIIPGFKMKCAKFFGRFVSDKKLMAITYRIQKKKVK